MAETKTLEADTSALEQVVKDNDGKKVGQILEQNSGVGKKRIRAKVGKGLGWETACRRKE